MDRAKHNVLPPSKFGVVEITRQRVRPETNINTSEKCPACNGTGEIQASILLMDEIENHLRYVKEDLKLKKIFPAGFWKIYKEKQLNLLCQLIPKLPATVF